MSEKTVRKVINDLVISEYFRKLSNEKLYDALWERIDDPEIRFRAPSIEADPEMKAIMCEIASRMEAVSDTTEQQIALAVAEERKRPFSIDILGMFREKLRIELVEGDVDFTKIFEEVVFEGDTYVDISDRGIDGIVAMAANALEMTLEHASELSAAKEFSRR